MYLLSLKDKQVDRTMMTLDFQAGVDKAVRYHLAKNGILGRQGDHGGGDT